MNHGVAGDGIDLTVCPAVGADRTREIRLLMENVIPLQHHCQRFSTQETMRQLHIPQQFVCVERTVAIATFAVHVKVGGEIGSPGKGYLRVSAIMKVPCGQVTRSLQFVFRSCIGSAAVNGKTEPLVPET